ncbi:MAG: hypothetical protein EOO50_03565 [Flavobacterium sp.]|uniref:hypothetical protein n=1 Tax=Flavobacterium sp. TaxID=239 RepID=UPI0011FADD6C|nr:hypothetical protein [Flavobacterium sp.]RZJ67912.1 MAG: hypothetical protein EOO50_03565 [Flavobacterium sp.]
MKFEIKNTYLNAVSFVLIVGLIGYFYFEFFTYTSNIPVNDDYKAILEFLNNFKADESFSSRMSLLFAQFNEHRIVYDRIWTLVSYKLFGKVDFNFLALIGNLSYLGIFLLLALPLRKRGWFYVLPVAILIFNFAFHENMTFPMATLSNNTGVLFSLLSIYFAVKSEKHAYLSIVFFVLAVLTVGSGLFLIFLLPAIFWYRGKKKLFWAFIGVAVATLALYFIGYQKPPQTPDVFETILYFKLKATTFFFSFIGSIFSYNLIFTNDLTDSVVFSAMFGLVMVIFYGYLIRKRYYKDNLLAFAMISFVILVAGITSVTRAQFGIETAIASRYKLYSAIMLVYCYYYFLEKVELRQSWRDGIVALFSLVYFFGISNKQTEYLAYRQHLNYLGVVNFYSGNHKMLNGFEQDLYKEILEKAKNYKIYTLPDESEVNALYPFSQKVSNLTQNTNTDAWFTHDVEQIYELKDSFLIFGKGFLDRQSSYEQNIYLELQDSASGEKRTFATQRMKRYDTNPYFKKGNLDYAGFVCRIKKEDLGSAEYSVITSISNDGLFRREPTDKKIKKTF